MRQQQQFEPTWKEARKAEWDKKKSFKTKNAQKRGKTWH